MGWVCFDFECRECGEIFENMVKSQEVDLQVCQKCGGKTDKVIACPHIQQVLNNLDRLDVCLKERSKKAALSQRFGKGRVPTCKEF